ncbi:MAG: HugZ family protein [Rubricella sp.]
MPKKDVLRETDGEAVRLARGLIRGARHAALAVLEPETGFPAVSRVSIATAIDGAPVILISRLSGHFGALEADPRCSLLFGEPGKGDPLAHPRVTVTAEARMVSREERPAIRERFLRYQPKAALYADFGDFAFWRLEPQRASLNGGFGKAYALSRDDLIAPPPDGLTALEPEAVAHMNEDHADTFPLYIGQPGRWTMAGLDMEGMDFNGQDGPARAWFDRPLSSADELRPQLVAMAKRARRESG